MWLLASRISRIMSRKISAPRAAALDAAIVRAHLQVAVEEFSGCINRGKLSDQLVANVLHSYGNAPIST